MADGGLKTAGSPKFYLSVQKTLGKNWPMDHKERCKYMFNNQILSDVKFVMQASQYGESNNERSKMTIPAHKSLLSICSPVFFAMFCGEMAETKEQIDLPDCEYEAMLELLRYIYTDEVCLNGNNVMQVLYLAEKYLIPCLTDKCTEYLARNLDLSNVFFILQHAHQYENRNLLCHCWNFFDKKTEEVLKSNEFQSMDRSFLRQLVERNTLSIREVELFKAVDCWAEEECKRQQLKADGSVKRQILGEGIVKNVRFPIMKQEEFRDVVLPSKMLTEEEISSIVKYFSSTLTSAVGFLDVHRVGCLLRCCTFKSFAHDKYFLNDAEEPVLFLKIIDKDIMLYGVSLLGNDGGEFGVCLNIVDETNNSILASKTENFTSQRRECNNDFYYGFDVIFDVPVALGKNSAYRIEPSVYGPGYMTGQKVIDRYVHSSGVTFEFDHDWVGDTDFGDLDQSVVIAELLFTVKE
ncbi:BTB/POZ domain-containing protein 2-like [Oculina patagonica]